MPMTSNFLNRIYWAIREGEEQKPCVRRDPTATASCSGGAFQTTEAV